MTFLEKNVSNADMNVIVLMGAVIMVAILLLGIARAFGLLRFMDASSLSIRKHNGPDVRVGSKKSRDVSDYTNVWLIVFPIMLFIILLVAGEFVFSITLNWQQNFLGDILLHVPRVAFDVEKFTEVGGIRHGQKCLFLWEIATIVLVICLAADVLLVRAVARRIDFADLGDFAPAKFIILMLVLGVMLYVYFGTELSLYGGISDDKKLPVTSMMFCFVGLVMWLVSFFCYYFLLFFSLYGKRLKNSFS